MSPRTIKAEVERLAHAAGMSPLEYIADNLANAVSLSELARRIEFSRSNLSTYANALPGASEALEAARAEGAHRMVEQALEIIDDVDVSCLNPAQAAVALNKAKAQAETRLWLAARHNQSSFGDRKASLAVSFDVSAAILEVMRAPVARSLAPAPQPTEADYEVEG